MSDQVAPESADEPLSADSRQLVEAGAALIACRTEDEVFDVMRDCLAVTAPDCIGLVDRCAEDPRSLVVHAVTGLDASALARAASLLGFDAVGHGATIAEEHLPRFRVRCLQKLDGGFKAFAAGYVPKPVADLTAKTLGLHDVHIIGITDGARTFGNLSIVTREPGKVLPAHAIESFVHLAFMALARIRADGDLADSEERFRALFESATDGIFLLSPEGVVVAINQSMARMHGYTADEMVRTDLRDLDTPETTRLAPERMGRLLAGESMTFEVEHRRKDGTTIPLEVTANLVVIGGEKHVLAFHRDITKRREQERELEAYRQHLEAMVETRTDELTSVNEELAATNEELTSVNEELVVANTELAAATEAKSNFLANMSHELRTPLNSIIGFSGVLLQGLTGPLQHEQRAQVEMVNRSGRLLLSLIDDVLDLAKMEAGREAVTIERVDPGAIATEVAEVVRPLAADKGLYLEIVETVVTSVFFSDEGKLRQILFNLVGNAVKFTESGGVQVTVRCEAGRACEFQVKDTGPGIGPDDLKRVFEPFTQLESTQVAKPKGTGLGLPISREYAHLLGGEITVVSEPGTGSTFTLTLPAGPRGRESGE